MIKIMYTCSKNCCHINELHQNQFTSIKKNNAYKILNDYKI